MKVVISNDNKITELWKKDADFINSLSSEDLFRLIMLSYNDEIRKNLIERDFNLIIERCSTNISMYNFFAILALKFIGGGYYKETCDQIIDNDVRKIIGIESIIYLLNIFKRIKSNFLIKEDLFFLILEGLNYFPIDKRNRIINDLLKIEDFKEFYKDLRIKNKNKIIKEHLINLCQSLLNDYTEILSKEEQETIKKILGELLLNEYDQKFEFPLLQILEKVWTIELESGEYFIISWNKYFNPKENGPITFATLNTKEFLSSFCNMQEGILYKITWDSIIAACPKDGATLIEEEDKESEYTIGKIGDKVINSYNKATRLVTPRQLIDSEHNNYPSKHNELILNTKHIIAIRPIDLENQKMTY